jgi:hypothetical protein
VADLDSEDSAVVLFKKLLVVIMENSVLPSEKSSFNFLRNFAKLVVNRHTIMSWNTEIDSSILEVIITLTIKNNVETRLWMKDVKLFELRDMMLVNIIRLNDDDDALVKLLTKFSFESICNQDSFRESFALANLVRVLVKTHNEDLQIFILKLFKFELTSEESQKEVAKLLNDQQIISFLFPNLKPKLLNLPCFSSNQLTAKEKPESWEQSQEMNKSVEIFLKVFNTDHFSDAKKKIDLQCQAALLEMQKSVRMNKTKALEKLCSTKNRVQEQLKEHEESLEKEKNLILSETLTEYMKVAEKNKKKCETYQTFLSSNPPELSTAGV